MLDYTLRIKSDNAAFATPEDAAASLASILRVAARDAENLVFNSPSKGEAAVRDLNGNTVGSITYKLTFEDPDE